MNDTRMQGWIDELHDTSGQQWLLRTIGVVVALGAMASAGAEVGRSSPFGLFVVAALAIASAFRPDSHTATAVIAIIAWHWLVVVERIDTVWLPIAACCLLTYHSVIALTATFPVGGVVPTATLLQWLRRTAIASGATVAMWMLVVLLDRREAPGNGLLTALALVIVASGAVAVRSRSLDEPG
jgi:hypothetical protein